MANNNKLDANSPRVGDSPDQREDTPSSREILRMASSVPLKYLGLLNHLQLQISCDSQG